MRPSTLTLAFTFTFTLTSCGFTGESIFAGRRIPDVSPWEDLGPITICNGPTRLGPMALGSLGTCTRPADQTACTTNADCGTRQRCVCGRCAIPVCDTSEECAATEVCTFGERVCDRVCKTDAECAAGESCVPGKGVCRGTCGTTADCQSGETCKASSGLCAPATCQDDSECGASRCALERRDAQLSQPTPLVENDAITLWFEWDDPTPAIWRATSTDGIRFDISGPSLDNAGSPSVVKTAAGSYLMLFTAASNPATVWRATSADGKSFTPDTQSVLTSATDPSLVQLADGSYAAYFGIPDGATGGRGVGRATSTNGVTFEQRPDALTPAQVSDPILWRDVDRIASPFAQALTGVDGKPFVRLWFSAHGTESASSMQFGKTLPTPPDFSIGEAASPSSDGADFQPYSFNPVFDRVIEFLTHPSELDPAVVPFRDQWLLFYRRAAADGTQSENLAVARSPAQPK